MVLLAKEPSAVPTVNSSIIVEDKHHMMLSKHKSTGDDVWDTASSKLCRLSAKVNLWYRHSYCLQWVVHWGRAHNSQIESMTCLEDRAQSQDGVRWQSTTSKQCECAYCTLSTQKSTCLSWSQPIHVSLHRQALVDSGPSVWLDLCFEISYSITALSGM
jgi:hypothetical protein